MELYKNLGDNKTKGVIYMAFFDYNHDGKKDWKDNAREYYLYNKMQEEQKQKNKVEKEDTHSDAKSNVGCGTVLLCFLFLFCMIQLAIWVNSL